MFLIEGHIRHVVSVLTYDVTLLRHMTSQNSQILKNICFFKWSRSKVKLKVKVKSR